MAGERASSAAARSELQRGREAYRRRAWLDALAILSRIDRETPLGAEDLERLAMSAYLTNRDDDCLRALERCHRAWLDEGRPAPAVRAAFWLGFRLASQAGAGGRPELGLGSANGWFARGQRVLESVAGDCVERGYLLVPCVEKQLAAGDFEAAFATAAGEAEIGRRFQDADLVACALHQQGRVLIRKGDAEAGFTLLDEAMVALVAGEVSPLMAGLVYCSVIQACREVYALGRAREWTSALARWCDSQPQIVAFTGSCLVHRAEIMQLNGAWRDAIEEAGRACERFRAGIDPQPPAPAFYQRAEMHRLRGAFAAAEADYRRASRFGCEPQPGLALLRLAQGRKAVAAAAIRRVLGATTRRAPPRAAPAGAGRDRARRRRDRGSGPRLPRARADRGGHRAGRAAGDRGAGPRRRPAGRRRRRGGARIPPPRAGGLAGDRRALRERARPGPDRPCLPALADTDGAELELAAARAVFQELGARPDVARVDAIVAGRDGDASHGLTPRERQVLRLVSAGKTNREIAAELCLSVRTIDRHLSNIFTKLDLPTRAAATAWSYEHGLI